MIREVYLGGAMRSNTAGTAMAKGTSATYKDTKPNDTVVMFGRAAKISTRPTDRALMVTFVDGPQVWCVVNADLPTTCATASRISRT